MANQSMITISTQDELCNWEFINHFDFELVSDADDESIYEIESIDLAESIDSVSSSVDDDDDDKDEEEEKDFPMNEGNLCGDDNGVNFSRVSDLGQNRGSDDDDLNNFVGNHHKIDGFVENFNGSRLDSDGVGSDADELSIHLHKQSPSSYYDGQHSNLHEYGGDDGNLMYTHTHDDDDEDDGHDDDVSDMDDDLIPWDVKDLLVKQRVRKSGKNSFRRMAKAKKSALVFTRPGCVRGKHGLGLKVY